MRLALLGLSAAGIASAGLTRPFDKSPISEAVCKSSKNKSYLQLAELSAFKKYCSEHYTVSASTCYATSTKTATSVLVQTTTTSLADVTVTKTTGGPHHTTVTVTA